MGYTHYFKTNKELNKEEFSKFASDSKILIEAFSAAGLPIVNGAGEKDTVPTINGDTVNFNGSENCGHASEKIGLAWPSKHASGIDNGNSQVSGQWFAGVELDSRACGGNCSYETFSFDRIAGKDYQDTELIFNCCKTNFKPYDLVVQAVLVIAKHYFKDNVVISSDGDINQWQDAIKICERLFKYGGSFNNTFPDDAQYKDVPSKEKVEEEQKEGDRQSAVGTLGTKEIAKRIRQGLKVKYPSLKFSVTMESYSGGSSITASLMSSDVKIIRDFKDISEDTLRIYEQRSRRTPESIKENQESKHHQLNGNHIRAFDPNEWDNGVFLTKEGHDIMQEALKLASSFNYDNSDAMTDYFDVNFYFHLQIGKWDKPLEVKE